MKKEEKNKGDGHRKRLRERFLRGGLDSFLDYEIIELLLTLGTPRKDCKQQAKQLIKKFKGLNGVLEASKEELRQIKGIGPSNILGIKVFQELLKISLKEKIPKKITLGSPKEVVDYLREKIGKEKKEYFLILSLDARSNLINIKTISIGSLDANIVHPREVFKKAIECSAASVILVHNHPSGDPEPSEDDLETTKQLTEAGKILGIEVVDHIIITKNNYFSFKDGNLI